MPVVGETTMILIGRESVAMRTTVPSVVVKVLGLQKDSKMVWVYEDGKFYITAKNNSKAAVDLRTETLDFPKEQRNMQGMKDLLMKIGLMETAPSRFAASGRMKVMPDGWEKGFLADQLRVTKEYLMLYRGDEPFMELRLQSIESLKIELAE